MASFSCHALQDGRKLELPIDGLLTQIRFCEKQNFSRTEALDFKVELKKRNVQLKVVVDAERNLAAYMLLAFSKPAERMRRLLLCALSSLARANPNINLPVNAQVPPVARAGQPFHFTFSDSTFTSPSELLSYSLAGAPTWLSLDGPSRTLSGIPTSEDTGAPVIELIANDTAGSTVMSITLVVTQEGGPGLGLPLADQLQANGAFAAPSSILVAPLDDISISLAPNTFTNASSNTVYYAVRDDRTPLPSWISFNPSSLSFSGVAPPAQPTTGGTQSFSFEVTASDVVGFSDAVLPFQIVVEPSLFVFKSNLQIVNVSPGTFFNDSSTLLNALTLNGTRVSPSIIQNVTASMPPWLHMETGGLALQGTPPTDFKGLNFTVEITDIYGTSTTTVVALDCTDTLNGLLIKPLGTVAVDVGCNFTYDLHQAATDANVTFQVDFGSSSRWLEYDQISKTIIGRFPSSVRPQQIFANVTAQRGSENQSEILTISLLDARSKSTAKEASPISKPATPQYSGNRGWIAAAVVIPVAAILALVLVVFLRWRKKGRQWSERDRVASSFQTSEKSIRVEKPPDLRRESSPERRQRLFDHGNPPRVIDVHDDSLESLYRMSDTSFDSRFQSAAPSMVGLDSLQECEPADQTYTRDSRYFNSTQAQRASSESVHPGLSAAELAGRRDSGPLRKLKNRFTLLGQRRMDTAEDEPKANDSALRR
ncbi:MAG: polarity establishment/cellular polarization [Ramalina farinacea]|uniref:Polarity establishment/cellular polarization n=1 Tax=Ramalina farinacea TaxID=258253 RepID=A0AA43QLT0_9LECA|nr:polarity establishment/cellular polarization [Ramalina farinacea]